MKIDDCAQRNTIRDALSVNLHMPETFLPYYKQLQLRKCLNVRMFECLNKIATLPFPSSNPPMPSFSIALKRLYPTQKKRGCVSPRTPKKLSLPVVQVVSNLNILTFKHSLYIIRKGLVPFDPLGVVGHSCHGVRAHTATGLRFGDDASEGVVRVGGREPFRFRQRREAASTTLQILIASSES